MASIAIMIGGAVLNATAFIGGNYLARALGGGDKAALEEKKRHDKALEDYQAAYAKYTRDRTQLLDWIATNAQTKSPPSRTSPTRTMPSNYTTRRILTNEWYPTRSPSSQISISQASSRKTVNSCSWASGRSLWATQPSGSFKLFYALLIWTPNLRKFTTAPGATGKESPR